MKFTLKRKILLILLLVGILPFLVIAIQATITAEKSIEEQTFNQLEAVRDIKKSSIERYFKTIEQQAKVVASSSMSQQAVSLFSESYFSFPEQQFDSEGFAKIKQSVKDYWQNQFGAEYQKQNKQEFDIKAFDELSKEAIYLQYAFISNNSHPLGSKNGLTNLDGSSRYAADHKRFHDWYNSFVSEFGY